MKAGELVVYEKTGDEEVNVTPLAHNQNQGADC
jgi:hypothetical protein